VLLDADDCLIIGNPAQIVTFQIFGPDVIHNNRPFPADIDFAHFCEVASIVLTVILPRR